MAEANVADLGGGDEHHYQFGVKMSCGGCSGAVERVLKKMDGVNKYEVSLDSQSADVYTTSDVTYDAVLEKIKKTGKEVTHGEADGVKQTV